MIINVSDFEDFEHLNVKDSIKICVKSIYLVSNFLSTEMVPRTSESIVRIELKSFCEWTSFQFSLNNRLELTRLKIIRNFFCHENFFFKKVRRNCFKDVQNALLLMNTTFIKKYDIFHRIICLTRVQNSMVDVW